MAEMEYLYRNRGVLSGPPLVYCIGNQKTLGKYCSKTWTDILIEVLHAGQPQVNLGKKDLKVKKGEGDKGERAKKESDRERERERKEILFQALAQCRTCVPSKCQGFRMYMAKGKERTIVPE